MRPHYAVALLAFSLYDHCVAAPQPPAALSDWNPFERISKNDSALLIVDHQVGLFSIARDWDATLFFQNIIGHAALGKLFDIPVVITTSAEKGPNGPIPKEILDMYPNVEVVRRNGEINAWDSPEFQDAIRATGKKQFIIGGIVTDVCTAFLALSLREEGYSVFANVEASATTTPLNRDAANSRMQAAGVHLVTLFAVFSDLMRDWRNLSPSVEEAVPWIQTYFPGYGMPARLHASALLKNGTVMPGVEKFI